MKNLAVFFMLCLLALACDAENAARLNVDEAFALTAEIVETERVVRLHWRIADGCFLLRNKFRFQSDTRGISPGTPEFPQSEAQKDDFFGTFEAYRRELLLYVPLKRKPDTTAITLDKLELTVMSQGCTDSIKNCYPLHAQRVSLALPSSLFSRAASPSLPDVALAAEPKSGAEINYESSDFLDPEAAFIFSIMPKNSNLLIARWAIADGYYIYHDKLKFSLLNAIGDAKKVLGKVRLPPSEPKQDPLFGKVEVYYHKLEAELPVYYANDLKHLSFKIGYQGCADAGLCYPPITKRVDIPLPLRPKMNLFKDWFQTSAATQNISPAASIAALGKAPVFAENEFLPAEDAFMLSAAAESRSLLTAHWQIAEGYYLYRHKLKFTLKGGGTIGEVLLPSGKPENDPEFGPVELYSHQLAVELPVSQTEGLDSTLLEISYQGCAEAGLCYPPQTETFSIQFDEGAFIETGVFEQAPAADKRITGKRIAGKRIAGNGGWIVPIFFGLGLLLALTPHGVSAIPALSNILAGEGKTAAYVAAVAFIYAAAGAIAGIAGANLQAAFQTSPWIPGGLAAFLIFLSLSRFGVYEFPASGAQLLKLSAFPGRQQSRTLAGAALMGFFSVPSISAGIAAPLAGMLIYIVWIGDALLGGLGLFALGIGMGAPLIAAATPAKKWLPAAGSWTKTVNQGLGMLLLVFAIGMLAGIVPAPLSLLLWGLLLIVSAIYMGALDAVQAKAPSWRRLRKGMGLIMLAAGAILLFGAAAGNTNVLPPLWRTGM
ncbi:MAG: thiol:disulfide interchange protein [Gammaproteobacteria bacterium]|nr:thiol:disulfide interchange protein [Gammaproteobacteria bacterium]